MSESFLMRIDDPADHILRTPTYRVRGWCAVPGWADVSQLELFIANGPVRWQEQVRPDVAAEYLESSVTGFVVDLDLSKYLYAIRSSELSLTLVFPGAPKMEVQFSVAPGVAARCLAAAAGV